MPTFSVLLAREARDQIGGGKRTELLQEYVGYIQRVAPGQAGVLTAGEGETTQAIRRRLNAAAELLGVSVEIRRAAGAVYFWTVGGPSATRQAPQEPGRLTNAEHPDENSRIRNASDRGFGNAAEVSLLRWPNGSSQEQEGEQRLLGLSEVPRL